MAHDLISYADMCRREGTRLRRGMHFGLGDDHSVLLMSVRPHAPYRDRFADEGTTLIYEGHDEPRSAAVPEPKAVDQPVCTVSGTLSANGQFHQAAQAYKQGSRASERVRVYEKLQPGHWWDHGVFQLVDSWREDDGHRRVFKFKLVAVGEREDSGWPPTLSPRRRRSIPTAVKVAVRRRDGDRCVVCGARQQLHFDHIVPYSMGGTSATADNIQLLCARHNLAKGAKMLASSPSPGTAADSTTRGSPSVCHAE
jgi:HNH endonuclease